MDILALVTRLCSIDPSINEHMRIANIRPKGKSCTSSAMITIGNNYTVVVGFTAHQLLIQNLHAQTLRQGT